MNAIIDSEEETEAEVDNLIFHQDNAPPRRWNETLMTIHFFGHEKIHHAPYSPDVGPLNMLSFQSVRGNRYEDLLDVRMAVQSAAAWYEKDWCGQIFM